MNTQDHNIRQCLPGLIQVIWEIYSDRRWGFTTWFLGEGEINLQDHNWSISKCVKPSWRKRRMLWIFLSPYLRLEILSFTGLLLPGDDQLWDAGDRACRLQKWQVWRQGLRWVANLPTAPGAEGMGNLNMLSLCNSVGGQNDTGKRHLSQRSPVKDILWSWWVYLEIVILHGASGQDLCFNLSDFWSTPSLGPSKCCKASDPTRAVRVSPPGTGEQGTHSKNVR